MYALILLRRGPVQSTPAIGKQHEEFIEELIRRDQILLGGKWEPAAGLYEAGYILNPNYALEAKRTNALVGFNPDLATLGFHQKGFS